DELSGQVAVRASIDATGLTVAGKSRALAAADRLFGGLIGIPAAYVEGVRARAETRNEIRNENIRAAGKRTLELLEGMDETGRVTVNRFVAEETRNQINREAVWAETQKAIGELPPPGSAESEDTSSELDVDWINILASYAERASSERLRQLWGRILAGEIRKPRSFALSTLRILSEMDAEIATAFQTVVRLRIGNDKVVKPEHLENDSLIMWTFLEEVGLLQDVNGSLSATYSNGSAGYSIERTTSFYLRITLSAHTPKVRVPFVRITRAGQQIAEIQPWDELSALRGLADLFHGDIELELGRVVLEYVGGFQSQAIEIIKPVSPDKT
ncbi:MAG: DUF2806 domain-containing protein, partial [Stellaceae bacterium]